MLGTALITKLLLDTQIHKLYVIVRGGKGEWPSNTILQKLERTLRPQKRNIYGSSSNIATTSAYDQDLRRQQDRGTRRRRHFRSPGLES